MVTYWKCRECGKFFKIRAMVRKVSGSFHCPFCDNTDVYKSTKENYYKFYGIKQYENGEMM